MNRLFLASHTAPWQIQEIHGRLRIDDVVQEQLDTLPVGQDPTLRRTRGKLFHGHDGETDLGEGAADYGPLVGGSQRQLAAAAFRFGPADHRREYLRLPYAQGVPGSKLLIRDSA